MSLGSHILLRIVSENQFSGKTYFYTSLELSAREVLDLLVDDVLHLQRPHHVSHELRVHVSVSDLVVEELSDCALRLGRDLLRLVADVQLGHLACKWGREEKVIQWKAVTVTQSLEKILSQIHKIQKSQSPVKGIKILGPQSI